jgi:hypothetical protein
MSATEDLAGTMLADRIVVISDQETYREILDDARAGDDEAQVIIGALQDADVRYQCGEFHCVDCGYALSPTGRRAGPSSCSLAETTSADRISARAVRRNMTTPTISTRRSAGRVRRCREAGHDREQTTKIARRTAPSSRTL